MFVTPGVGELSLPLGTRSNFAAKQTSDHSDANFMAYLRYCGMFPDTESVREKEILSPQLKVICK